MTTNQKKPRYFAQLPRGLRGDARMSLHPIINEPSSDYLRITGWKF